MTPPAFFQTVNDRDVRMVQRREDFRFTLKAGDAVPRQRRSVRQDLDGDLAIQLRVARPIHLRPCRLRRFGAVIS